MSSLLHYSSGEVNYRLWFSRVFSIHVIINDARIIKSTELSTEMVTTDRQMVISLPPLAFIWREQGAHVLSPHCVGRCQAAEQRRACRCPSTRGLAALLVACRFQAGALRTPLDWRSVGQFVVTVSLSVGSVIKQLTIMCLSSSSSSSSSHIHLSAH